MNTGRKEEQMAERWWVVKGGFKWDAATAFNDGRLYSGPYSTREDAFTARRTIEQILARDDFFVEMQPAPAELVSQD